MRAVAEPKFAISFVCTPADTDCSSETCSTKQRITDWAIPLANSALHSRLNENS